MTDSVYMAFRRVLRARAVPKVEILVDRHSGFYTYRFQNLCFMDNPQSLTLWLDDTVWLNKDVRPVTVDLTDGSWTGKLPAEVTGLSAERVNLAELGERWVLKVSCIANRSPFELEYRDPGGRHSQHRRVQPVG